MKKLALVMALVFALVPAVALAGSSQMNTGCGLGTLIFKGKAEGSLALQLLVTFTNGIFGNQTFGMTTGTLECSKPVSVVRNERVNEFARANLDGLAKDIAAGKGETLSTLSELMEVPQAQREEFGSLLKANFGAIFPTADVTYAQVVDAIVSVAQQG